MSDVQEGSRKSGSLVKLALIAVVVVGVAALLYVMASAAFKPKPSGDLMDLRKGALSQLEVPGHAKPRNPKSPEMDMGVSPAASPAPDVAFDDADKKPVKIADFKGKVVIVNLWATWCAPCKIEMPTLAKLQAAYQAQPLQVLALSADVPEKAAEARAFIDKNAPLRFYVGTGSGILFKFTPQVNGLPGTIIYDKKGNERARVSGGVDWNSKEVRAMVDRLLAEPA
jgi:thiol-disulfide isomerase/thioredoxin